jgi:hypothetical protein
MAFGVPSEPQPDAQGAAIRTDAPTAPKAAGPLVFSGDPLDMGEFIAGRPKTAELVVTNASNAPVTVLAIKAGCGCTTVSSPPKDPVPAGGSFTLDVTLDPGHKTGVELVKSMAFTLDGERVQTTRIKGFVKTVVRTVPDIVDANSMPAGAHAVVTLESVDGAPFRVTGAEPADFVALPKEAAASHRIEIDWKAWEKAGRPSKLSIRTDHVDATTLVVPIKGAPAVVLFRLPATTDGAEAAAQDEVILAIDAALERAGRSKELRMRLHRETGMLFVHGTDGDLAAVRDAVRTVPSLAGVRESTP